LTSKRTDFETKTLIRKGKERKRKSKNERMKPKYFQPRKFGRKRKNERKVFWKEDTIKVQKNISKEIEA
jgi:hypothetical protein